MAKLSLLVLALVAYAASALVVGQGPRAHTSRVAATPLMACNGGKGGKGGMSPPKDKMRRGKLKALIQAADSAENVQAILLSAQTEGLLLKMNWKVRKFAKKHVLKRAAQFDVDVPEAFAGFNSPKQSTKKHLLTPSITERSPAHPAAVAALAKLRAT